MVDGRVVDWVALFREDGHVADCSYSVLGHQLVVLVLFVRILYVFN
jgi:hypothetical protein